MKLSISPRLEELWAGLYRARTLHSLAQDVRKLSDHYIHNHGALSPFDSDEALAAYAAYFMPLNVLRLKDVFREVARFIPEVDVAEIWDFGSGLGATQFMFEESSWSPRPFFALEKSAKAIRIHQDWSKSLSARFSPMWNPDHGPRAKAFAVFSFSYLEMKTAWNILDQFDHILLVEPSFQDTGRVLMEARAEALARGFKALAPCTHDRACPLLTHSHKDWCHQRAHVELPPKLHELEKHLPIKNRTVTYSYLLISKTVSAPAYRTAGRVIGDTLFERGKVRQLVCRGPDREFLSWLTREGEPESIPHGAIVENLDSHPLKGNEIRLTNLRQPYVL